MMKYLIPLACLIGSVAAEVDVQTELYIVAGILGGACLLLTIAIIYNSVTIIGLQSKVAVLQAAGTATVRAVVDVMENSPPPASKPTEPIPQQNPYSSEPRNSLSPANQNPLYDDPDKYYHQHDERDPYESRPAREDPYRRQDSRGGHKMERQNSRPYQDERRNPAGYY